MKDPYAVLGINRNATDEEIKSAYREMAKKYHPDNYENNPLSDLAEEKMREINEAYDSIMASRRSGRRAGAQSNFNSADSNFPDVRSLISSGRFEEAQEILDGVPPERRDAEWYFLNGTVLYRRGWFDAAFTSLNTACRMDPSNEEYRQALSRAQNGRNGFVNGGFRTYPAGGECTACDLCQGLICADCCCECMGGDLIRCC